jgi:regulator of protease activity HflC (stomatin/prohibitin superfamily)
MYQQQQQKEPDVPEFSYRTAASQDWDFHPQSGALMFIFNTILLGLSLFAFVLSGPFALLGVLGIITMLIIAGGFFIVNPNDSRVMTLFGTYKGTVKKHGYFWANPFFTKKALSLRARTINGEKLKVNDQQGNPIEIAAIIVWKISDTYKATFEVDDCEQYVYLQSETAVRHLASTHPYDADNEQDVSLRRNTDVVSSDLKSELEERLAPAGIVILDARLSHLAYSPEIAGAMLRRQQATAVISARQKIVEGAVGMVEMALHQLEAKETVKMTDDQKAHLVSNLLVVLCSEQSAHPVVNAGSPSNSGKTS